MTAAVRRRSGRSLGRVKIDNSRSFWRGDRLDRLDKYDRLGQKRRLGGRAGRSFGRVKAIVNSRLIGKCDRFDRLGKCDRVQRGDRLDM